MHDTVAPAENHLCSKMRPRKYAEIAKAQRTRSF